MFGLIPLCCADESTKDVTVLSTDCVFRSLTSCLVEHSLDEYLPETLLTIEETASRREAGQLRVSQYRLIGTCSQKVSGSAMQIHARGSGRAQKSPKHKTGKCTLLGMLSGMPVGSDRHLKTFHFHAHVFA